jgi:hypothetical protein
MDERGRRRSVWIATAEGRKTERFVNDKDRRSPTRLGTICFHLSRNHLTSENDMCVQSVVW